MKMMIALLMLMLVGMGNAQICGNGYCQEYPGLYAINLTSDSAQGQLEADPDPAYRAIDNSVQISQESSSDVDMVILLNTDANVPSEDQPKFMFFDDLGQPDERDINFLLMTWDDKTSPIDQIALFLGFSYLNVNVTRDGIVTLDSGDKRQIKYVFPFWQLVRTEADNEAT